MKRLTKKLTTKEKNAAFAKLPRAQKRVEIAKDVIKQLNADKITAISMIYFSLRRNRNDNTRVEGKDLQSLLKPSKAAGCDVCAIGAIFYSKVRKMNECKLEAGETYSASIELSCGRIMKNMSGIFTNSQMNLIEQAFEVWGGAKMLRSLENSTKIRTPALKL